MPHSLLRGFDEPLAKILIFASRSSHKLQENSANVLFSTRRVLLFFFIRQLRQTKLYNMHEAFLF